MGGESSRYDRTEIDRYTIYDDHEPYRGYEAFKERDRDDYDDCCGCGPWYGGSAYREARRKRLPGYGSPPGNHFARGGYAGEVARTELANEMQGVVPYRQTQVLAPGYMAPNLAANGYMAPNMVSVYMRPEMGGGYMEPGYVGGNQHRLSSGMW
jgi:hypothetical protein